MPSINKIRYAGIDYDILAESAAQIETNKNDITDLKDNLSDIADILDVPFHASKEGDIQASQAVTLIDNIPLIAGHVYTIHLTYSSGSDAVSYLYLTDAEINVLISKTLPIGSTEITFVYVANRSYDGAKLLINTSNRLLNYTLVIQDDATSRLERIETEMLHASVYSNDASVVFQEAGTLFPDNPVKDGNIYKISVVGATSVGVNVRAGDGSSAVGNIALGCTGGKTYFVRYSGDDAKNLIIYASGACTVMVENINTISKDDQRVYATVYNVRELLECIEISHYVKMTIKLMDGVYDLIAGLGTSYFDDAPSQNFGPILCNDVILIGEEGAVIKAHYTGTNENVMKFFSPFNTGKCVYPWELYGGFTLRNIHLEGSRIRYLVHDENNQHDIPYHNVYDGCYFYFDNSDNHAWTSHAIIGGGLGKHGYIEIKNCVFKTPALVDRTSVVSYHNSLATGAKSHIIVTGNLLSPKNAVFRLGYHGTSEEKTLVLATNNLWGGVPSVSAEGSSDVVENFELVEWNNVILS